MGSCINCNNYQFWKAGINEAAQINDDPFNDLKDDLDELGSTDITLTCCDGVTADEFVDIDVEQQ